MEPKNLYEYYTGKKQELPSLEERGKLYESYGLGTATDYVSKNKTGDVGPNTTLLAKLLAGDKTTSTNALGGLGGGNDAVSTSDGLDAAASKELEDRAKKEADDAAALRSLNIQKQIQDLRTSLTPAGGAPAAPNFKEQYKSLIEEKDTSGLSFTDIQNRLVELNTMQEEAYARLRGAAEKQPKAAPEDYGQRVVSNEEKKIRDEIDFYSRQINTFNLQLQNRNSVISTMLGLGEKDYGIAADRYDKEFSNNLQLYNSVLSSGDKIADNAKASLQVIQNELAKGSLNYSTLPQETKNTIDALEQQAGLPKGITSFITGTTKGSIVAQGTRTDKEGNTYFDILTKQEDGSMKVTTVYRGKSEVTSDDDETKIVDDFNSTVADYIVKIDNNDLTYEGAVKALKSKFGAYGITEQSIYAALGPK